MDRDIESSAARYMSFENLVVQQPDRLIEVAMLNIEKLVVGEIGRAHV